MRGVLALLGALLAAPAYGQTASAAAPPAPTNEDCATCHGDATAARADGTSVAVDAARFAASVHGQLGLSCVDCHADALEVPHADALRPVECATCHEAATTAYRTGVHAPAGAGGEPAGARCIDCHGTHDILPSSDPLSATYHLNLARTCGRCHGTGSSADVPGGNVLSQFTDSIHGRALERAGLLVAPSCASCHGAHDILDNAAPESRVFRARVPDTCGTCHEGVERVFAASVHGTLLAQGHPRAPVCSDCHTAHAVVRSEQDTFRVGVIGSACGSCHREALATYRDTFHGQVTELGYSQVATCADCHSAHAQFPKADPRSTVSDVNRLTTCQQCHPTANANFARYDPHADAHDYERGPVLYYTARFMTLLLAGVFGFFGLHTTLWFARSLREARARRAGPPAPTEDTDA
jgi:hypothetical protein